MKNGLRFDQVLPNCRMIYWPGLRDLLERGPAIANQGGQGNVESGRGRQHSIPTEPRGGTAASDRGWRVVGSAAAAVGGTLAFVSLRRHAEAGLANAVLGNDLAAGLASSPSDCRRAL